MKIFILSLFILVLGCSRQEPVRQTKWDLVHSYSRPGWRQDWVRKTYETEELCKQNIKTESCADKQPIGAFCETFCQPVIE